MRYRVTFLAGFATGFVVGARAGRERYEQMMKLARRAAEHPVVQQTAGAAAAQASGLAKTAKDKVTEQVQQRAPGLADAARQKAGGLQKRVPGMRTGDAAGSDGQSGVPSTPASGGSG